MAEVQLRNMPGVRFRCRECGSGEFVASGPVDGGYQCTPCGRGYGGLEPLNQQPAAETTAPETTMQFEAPPKTVTAKDLADLIMSWDLPLDVVGEAGSMIVVETVRRKMLLSLRKEGDETWLPPVDGGTGA